MKDKKSKRQKRKVMLLTKGSISLFNGENLEGWRTRYLEEINPKDNLAREIQKYHQWVAKDSFLFNKSRGADIITKREFSDFILYIEYLIPRNSNSGIYLRGQYELQILDSFERKQTKNYNPIIENGSLYNMKAPDIEASKPAGEWQALEATLKGMILNVNLNGKKIHTNVKIENPTGGELINLDPLKGPLMLQGDHGPVMFRNIKIQKL
jgi:hypothetical protein